MKQRAVLLTLLLLASSFLFAQRNQGNLPKEDDKTIFTNQRIIDVIPYLTARIVRLDDKGMPVGYGTGFFYSIKQDSGTIVTLLTNKHVIEGPSNIAIVLHARNQNDSILFNDTIFIKKKNFDALWIPHSDTTIDLGAFLISPILNYYSKKQKVVYQYFSLNNRNIPDSISKAYMFPIEDVTMIGYPNGLWDSKNNLPIFEKGVTATDVRINFNGEKKFLVNISAVPGSSGSPILLLNNGNIVRHGRQDIGGLRVSFIGIIFAAFFRNEQGNIILNNIPLASILPNINATVNTKFYIGIGACISSSEVLTLEKQILAIAK